MKKIFFFIAALAVAFTANAKVTTISPDADNDALRLAVHYAEDGDIIEMTEGTYVQCNNGYVAFDGKAVTVRAAEGANVVLQPQVRITLANGGKATFENIKIDASRIHELADWYEHVFYVADATEGKELVMEGCEFYGFDLNKSAIYSKATNKLDLCSLTNCYFHNNDKSCLFFEGESLGELSITNSTFANITAKVTDNYYAGVVDVRNSAAKVTIDHCTFYNCLQMGTDYATVTMKGPQAANVTISNNIFVLPEATDGQRAIRNDVEATNCLTFNYLKDSGTGIHSSVTKTNCLIGVDPLLVDAANGNYALGEGSPALGAATDGSHLGDPRWNAPAEEEEEEVYYEPFVFSNLEITDNVDFWVLTASDASMGLDLMLGVNTADASIMDASQILFGGDVLPILSSEPLKVEYNEELGVVTYTARVVVDLMGSKLGLELIMYEGGETIQVVAVNVFDATATVDDAIGVLKIIGSWEGVPFELRVNGYEPEKVQYDAPQIGEFETEELFAVSNSVTVLKVGDNVDVIGEFTDWSGNTYSVSVSAKFTSGATGLDNLDTTVAPAKLIENGQLIIIKNGVRYNATGAILK